MAKIIKGDFLKMQMGYSGTKPLNDPYGPGFVFGFQNFVLLGYCIEMWKYGRSK